MILRFRLSLFFLALGFLSNAMQKPTESNVDLFVKAAGNGKLDNLKIGISKKVNPNALNSSGRSALGMAASLGQVEAVQFLLGIPGINPNIKDQPSGLTPLHWASLYSDRNKPLSNYLAIINLLLNAGADINARDANGLTVLHEAARTGNLDILELLLHKGASKFVNDEGSKEKGRTPLTEALRASKDALIHVYAFENQDIDNEPLFNQELEKALQDLEKKESKKLNTNQIIRVIDLLKKYGAHTNIADALGNMPAYYIDEVQLVSDHDRIILLNALDAPVQPRMIVYGPEALRTILPTLEEIKVAFKKIGLDKKIQMVIWTIQKLLAEPNETRKYNLIRIAMGLLSKIKEDSKGKVTRESFPLVERGMNAIRTILRDTALLISGKATLTPQAPPSIPTPIKGSQQMEGILITEFVNKSRRFMPFIKYRIVGSEELENHQLRAAVSDERPEKLILNKKLNFILISVPNATPKFLEELSISKTKPNTLESTTGVQLPLDKFAVSKFIFSGIKEGELELVPDVEKNPAAAGIAPYKFKGTQSEQVSQIPQGMFEIDKVINFSNQPVTVIINSEPRQEYQINPAKDNSPTILAINKTAGLYAPLIVKSYTLGRSHRVIPSEPNIIEAFNVSTGTDKQRFNISEYKISNIVIDSNGGIKLVPSAKAAQTLEKTLKTTAQPISAPVSTPKAEQFIAPNSGISIATIQNNFGYPIKITNILEYPGGEMDAPAEYDEKETIIPAKTTKTVNEFLQTRFDYFKVETEKDSLLLYLDLDKNLIYIAGRPYPLNQYKISTIIIDQNGKISVAPLQSK